MNGLILKMNVLAISFILDRKTNPRFILIIPRDTILASWYPFGEGGCVGEVCTWPFLILLGLVGACSSF